MVRIPWITSANIHGVKDVRPERYISQRGIDNSATNLVPKGSIVVVTRVSLGKLALAGRDICFSQDSQALLPNGYIFPEYALYYLSQAVQIFKYQNRGTRINGVTKKQLSDLPFPVAPLPEQHRIVAKIEELFTQLVAGVAELRQVKAQLKRYRQAVLKAAVEGELTREWREAHRGEIEPASLLLERILEERRAKWEAKQLAQMRGKGKEPKDDRWKRKYKEATKPDIEYLPELPEGWVWARTDQLANVQTGATPLRSNAKYWENGEIPWVTSGALNDLCVREAAEFITELALTETNTKIFPKHTLLVAMYGEGRTRGKVSELLIDAATNQACAALIIEPSSAVVKDYVKLFFRHNYNEIRRRSSGGVQPNLTLGIIKKALVPLPPLGEQAQIINQTEFRLSTADAIDRELDKALTYAELLRKSILLRAFRGCLVPQDPNDEPASVLLIKL